MLKQILLNGYFYSAIWHLLSITDLKLEWVVSGPYCHQIAKIITFQTGFLPGWPTYGSAPKFTPLVELVLHCWAKF